MNHDSPIALAARVRRGPGRPSHKRNRVLSDLRKRIVNGQYQPSQRLPTRAELEAEMDVSWGVIQGAFDRLQADGFVVARGTRGTFVADHPPCFCHFGLALPTLPNSPRQPWTRFYDALLSQSEAISRSTDRRITTYCGVETREGQKQLTRLLRDLRHQRLAGLFLVNCPVLAREVAPGRNHIPALPDIPSVVYSDQPCDVPAIQMDYPAMLRCALERVARAGRKRLAIIGVQNLLDLQPTVDSLLAEFDLECRSYWRHVVAPHPAVGVTSCIHAVFQPEQARRPDSLLVVDDNLLMPAVEGLQRASIRIPEDVLLVTHSNLPAEQALPVPAIRVGFDTRELLSKACELVDLQRTSTGVNSVTLIPPRID